jgi:hypothetical protein
MTDRTKVYATAKAEKSVPIDAERSPGNEKWADSAISGPVSSRRYGSGVSHECAGRRKLRLGPKAPMLLQTKVAECAVLCSSRHQMVGVALFMRCVPHSCNYCENMRSATLICNLDHSARQP